MEKENKLVYTHRYAAPHKAIASFQVIKENILSCVQSIEENTLKTDLNFPFLPPCLSHLCSSLYLAFTLD